MKLKNTTTQGKSYLLSFTFSRTQINIIGITSIIPLSHPQHPLGLKAHFLSKVASYTERRLEKNKNLIFF